MNTYRMIKSGHNNLGNLYDVIDADNMTYAVCLPLDAASNLVSNLNSGVEGQL